jgi:hypothetical protein
LARIPDWAALEKIFASAEWKIGVDGLAPESQGHFDFANYHGNCNTI